MTLEYHFFIIAFSYYVLCIHSSLCFLNILSNGSSTFWTKEVYVDGTVLSGHRLSHGFLLFDFVSIKIRVTILHVTFKL